MATYFGYVKRDEDSYINWANIGSEINKNIEATEKAREEKRAAFEKDSREVFNSLRDNPMGQNQSVNEYSLQLGNDAQNYLLQLNKLVKSNKMKISDYMVRAQNLKDDTLHMYGIMKGYQERAKEVAERQQKGLSQPFETDVYAQLEGFGNFAKSYAYIDPSSGHLWQAEKQKQTVDGKDIYSIPTTPTGKLQQMQSLAQTMKMNYDKFNTQEILKGIKDRNGKYMVSVESVAAAVGKPGRIKEILDPTYRGKLDAAQNGVVSEFEKAETAQLKSLLTNNFNTLSVLQGDMGGYSTTFNEKEAAEDPNKVLIRVINNQYQPDFSTENGKKQYDAALEHLRTSIRPMYDHVETTKETAALPDIELARTKEAHDWALGQRTAATAERNARTSEYNAQTARYGAETSRINANAKTPPPTKKSVTINKETLSKAVDEAFGEGENWYVEDKPTETKEKLTSTVIRLADGLGFSVEGGGIYDDYIIIKPPRGVGKKFTIDEPGDWMKIKDYFKDPKNYNPKTVPEAWGELNESPK